MVNDVFGLSDLDKYISKEVKATEQKLEKVVDATVSYVEKRAKYYVPVDTARLQNSIVGYRSHQVLEAFVATDIEYAETVEYGTWKSGAQPFLRPAAADGQKYIEAETKKMLRG